MVTHTRAELEPLFDTPARTLAEAIERLRDARDATGQYPDDLVDALLERIDAGADEVAAYERERYATWFDRCARNGRALAQGTRGGLHLAAQHLRDDLARFRPGDPTP